MEPNIVPIRGKKVGSCLQFERDGFGTLDYDFKDRRFYQVKDGKRRQLSKGQDFFVHVPYSEVSKAFADEAYGKFIRKIQQAENRCSNVATLLDRINAYAHWEQYFTAGIAFPAYQGFARPITDLPKEVVKFLSEYCSFGNRDVEIAGNVIEQLMRTDKDLVVNLMAHVRREWYLDMEVYGFLYNLLTHWNGELVKFKKLIVPVDTPIFITKQGSYSYETRRYMMETVQDGYGFGCEYKVLFDYLVRADRTEALPFLTAISTYLDYRSMYRQMLVSEVADDVDLNRTVNAIEKYPRWLKAKHDLVARNFNSFKVKYDETLFASLQNPELAYEYGKYAIVVPETTDDIKTEGVALSHCVSSYIEKVMNGECHILFMRLRQALDVSQVTVELRGGAMAHARGFNNRQITFEEEKFLRTYCKSKGFKYDND